VPPYTQREYALSQGDIFPDVPFTVPHGDFERKSLVSPGIVTSHDCECEDAERCIAKGIEDPGRLIVSAAPVFPITILTGGKDGDVRGGRVLRFFHLPAADGLEESFADLAYEQPVPATLLMERQRIICLSDEYRAQMLVHQWRLKARDLPVPPPREAADGT
jgi:hypothetical protein